MVDRQCWSQVLGDAQALDQFHHKVRPAHVSRARIQHFGNVGVVHQGQGLAFGLEAGENLTGIHARLDYLEGDLALNRLLLVGKIDDATPTLADFLQQLVATNAATRLFGHGNARLASRLFGEELLASLVGAE